MPARENCPREAETIAQAAEVVHDACQCGMMKSMDAARKRLQELSAGTSDVIAIAHAAHVLGLIVRYGDVRKFDPEPLMPLVEELFVQGALALHADRVNANRGAESTLAALAVVQLGGLVLDPAVR